MNAADTLALARYVAFVILDCAPECGAAWEDVPGLCEADWHKVAAMLPIVALQLAEQAGDRGRELYEAAQ